MIEDPLFLDYVVLIITVMWTCSAALLLYLYRGGGGMFGIEVLLWANFLAALTSAVFDGLYSADMIPLELYADLRRVLLRPILVIGNVVSILWCFWPRRKRAP